MWKHWYRLTQAWGSTTYNCTLGQILPRCREESCQQSLKETSVKEKTQVCVAEGSKHESKCPSGWLLQTNPVKPLPHLGWRDRLDSIHCQEHSNLLVARQGRSGMAPKSRERRWTWEVAWRTESHSRVELCIWLMSQRDGLGSMSHASRHRASSSNDTIGVPVVVQRRGAGLDGTEGNAFWDILAELPGSETGLARGAWGDTASPNRTLLAAGKIGRGRYWGSNASHTFVPWTWEPGGKGNCSFFEKVGTKWAEQK